MQGFFTTEGGMERREAAAPCPACGGTLVYGGEPCPLCLPDLPRPPTPAQVVRHVAAAIFTAAALAAVLFVTIRSLLP